MLLNKWFWICISMVSALGYEPIMPEVPEEKKGITLVDSIVTPCFLGHQEKCEVYLLYDIQDDVVYVVKRWSRTKDRAISSIQKDREKVKKQSIKIIDLVPLFSDKTSPVKRYSARFQKEEGVYKVYIKADFEQDQGAPTEKSVDVDLYAKPLSP